MLLIPVMDAMTAAMFSQHQAERWRPDDLGEKRKIGTRLLQQPVLMHPRFGNKQVLSDHRFVDRRVHSSQTSDQPAELVELAGVGQAVALILIVVHLEGYDH